MTASTRSEPSKGALRAAEAISRFTTLNSKNGVPWAAKVIDRETKAGEMAELLRETVSSLTLGEFGDIAKRAERLLSELEGKG